MTSRIHALPVRSPFVMVVRFWCSTMVAGLFLSADAVLATKRAVLFGIALLIPALDVRHGLLLSGKTPRMRRVSR